MTENQTNRRLAAILAADVVGYSRLMAKDETGTLDTLKHYRETVFYPTVRRHGGRVFKLVGDGALVEFASAVDAVRCAVALQTVVPTAEQATKAFMLRIGINLGDVIIDGDDVYGDGVNVASRLEPLAAPGGICVASIVNESVGSRVDVAFTDGGEVALKNIDRPVRIWKWHPEAGAAETAVTTDASAMPAARAPAGITEMQSSIAVLPFDNMSGDPEQEYFSDGISEDIITDLSKVGGLLVIARNSSFTYKGKSVDIRTVGRELGVKAVLEGSIRRAGNRVRINAQLIDATNGAHLWADRFDRDLTDIFAVQDEVTRCIVDALKVNLSPGKTVRNNEVPTRNMEAHDLFLRGREALFGTTANKETFELAVRCFTRAIELDPDYAEPYVGLSHAFNRDFQNNYSARTDSKELSAYYCRLALEKGPDLPYAHYVNGLVKFWERDMAASREAIDKALALNPNFVLAVGMRGVGLIYDGKPLEAIPDLESAFRLDPLVGHIYIHFIGSAYLIAGQYQNAVDAFQRRIDLAPDTDLSRGMMIAALGHLGDTEEAKRVWTELKAINPKYSFAGHIARLPLAPADAERISEGFAKTGLSD